MAARGSQVMQYVPTEVYQSATPPASPAVGQLWRNTGVTPNELLAWTGNGTSVARRYAASKSGVSVPISDLSDDHTLGMTVNTTALQASGTPSLSNNLSIGGRSSVTVLRSTGKNKLPKLPMSGLASTRTINGVTFTTQSDGSIKVQGTATSEINHSFGGAWNSLVPLFWLPAGTYTITESNASIDIRLISVTSSVLRTSIPTTTLAADKAITEVIIYIASGTTVDTTIYPQVESGSAVTAYEAYSGTSYTLTPSATLWGLPTMADSVSNTGQAIHNTGYASIDGTSSSWYDAGNAGSTTRLYAIPLYTTESTTQTTYTGGLMCNRAVDVGSQIFSGGTYQDTGSTCCLRRVSGTTDFRMFIRVPTSLCADLAAWKTWLNSNPLQVIFRRETPTVETVSTAAIVGGDGANTVTSDGAAVVVTYTGTGWAALGAVERVAVESVSITPEFGLKVAQVLTDGTNVKNIYTRLFHGGLQIFDADTGGQIGGLFMQGGEVYLFASALSDPRALADMAVRIYAASDSSHQFSGFEIVISNVVKGRIFASRNTSLGIDLGMVFDALGERLTLKTNDGNYMSVNPGTVDLRATSGTNEVFLYLNAEDLSAGVEGTLIPAVDNTYDCGRSTLRWKKYYGVSSTISTSDAREKHDIVPLDPEVMLAFVMALHPSQYRLNCMPEDLGMGFVAQDFLAAMRAAGIPDDYGGFVDESPDHSHLALRYEQVIAPIVSVMQQQQRKIIDLERRLAKLERRVT